MASLLTTMILEKQDEKDEGNKKKKRPNILRGAALFDFQTPPGS